MVVQFFPFGSTVNDSHGRIVARKENPCIQSPWLWQGLGVDLRLWCVNYFNAVDAHLVGVKAWKFIQGLLVSLENLVFDSSTFITSFCFSSSRSLG